MHYQFASRNEQIWHDRIVAIKYPVRPIIVDGPMGLSSTIPTRTPAPADVLLRHPMPEGWAPEHGMPRVW